MWTRHGGGGTMQSGRGQHLYDDSGAQYIDCINSTAQGAAHYRIIIKTLHVRRNAALNVELLKDFK
jgi:4-aminobutyrate aminotransferase-like enzyme